MELVKEERYDTKNQKIALFARPERQYFEIYLVPALGAQINPRISLDRRTISVAIRFLKAKTPEQRAAVDLDTHYTKEYLDEYVGSSTRRAILHDIIAQIYYARRLAEKLQPVARMVDLHGGHLVSHERTKEVNQALHELINASETKMSPHDWTNLPKKASRWSEKGSLLGKTIAESKNDASSTICIAEKLHLSISYVFGLFMFMFEYIRRAIRSLHTARVGTSLT
ncbi:unnamed protein product [Dovyalis caffra]|uniref:Uncharacterized protein n=1 Tax=Dovyalis caffra TaxID=77055 RepID=A0AAV1QU46_9ROSI|nr:unnamed protein product [Dovyalis caffra]